MTTLDPSADHYIIINTFTVEPDQADALLTSLSKATLEVFRHAPGFVSANLHVSDDKCHVANYAQWRSRKAYEEAGQRPEVQSHKREAAKFATSFQAVFYDLVKTHQSPEGS